MSIRSLMLVSAIAFAGCVAGADTADTADNSTASVAQNTGGGGFGCQQGVVGLINVVTCNGSVLALPVNIDIKDVRVLNDNELNVLSGNLNDLADLENVLNISKILDDNEVKVFDVLTGFNILNFPKSNIDVCILNLLGIQVCK